MSSPGAVEPPDAPATSADPASDRPRWRSIAAGAAIVAAVVLVFVLIRGGDDDPPADAARDAPATTTAASQPVATTPERLAALSEQLGRPIFWVGPSRGRTLELTQNPSGLVFVRYLDAGVEVGDPRPDFVTIGTYRRPDPFATVAEGAERDGARVEELDGGGLAYADGDRPTSWYVAYPDWEDLVEVFSPTPAKARELVRGTRLVPVGR